MISIKSKTEIQKFDFVTKVISRNTNETYKNFIMIKENTLYTTDGHRIHTAKLDYTEIDNGIYIPTRTKNGYIIEKAECHQYPDVINSIPDETEKKTRVIRISKDKKDQDIYVSLIIGNIVSKYNVFVNVKYIYDISDIYEWDINDTYKPILLTNGNYKAVIMPIRNNYTQNNRISIEDFVEHNVYTNQTLLVDELIKNNIIDPPDFEAYEYWTVSDFLLKRLKTKGENILESDYQSWWARNCTGQSIILDKVIKEIYKEFIN